MSDINNNPDFQKTAIADAVHKELNNTAWHKKMGLAAAVGAPVMLFGSSAFAAAGTYDVTTVETELGGAAVPIAAVASASLGAYVGLRVWKMVRRAI